ncbi:MAG TPA: aminoacyl-tRNA hydrolase, partial [Candidatus Methylomirabilis sp.]|nr:aminoacyl-tRNA hydrolase [Candidatus Methylomirabilis sp.]
RTRHNVGFAVVDRLAGATRVRFGRDRYRTERAWSDLSGVPILLVKPQAFMNLSGPPVAAWLERLGLPATRLVVIHDDLDLPLGRLRVSARAGPGGHRGVASIQAALGTQVFPRVRVGIGRPGEGQEASDRVLEAFAPEELPMAEVVIDRAAEAVRILITEGQASAMNQYNVRGRASGAQV